MLGAGFVQGFCGLGEGKSFEVEVGGRFGETVGFGLGGASEKQIAAFAGHQIICDNRDSYTNKSGSAKDIVVLEL